MDELALLVDLHRAALRQGPGGEHETRLAMELAGLDTSRSLNIADIGCGTGAATLQLAKELNAHITAIDFLPEFLEELQNRAILQGVADRITTLHCSMDALPFADETFDVIWSEGAIYNMGFAAGISAWKRFLKPGGKLVVSEITWISGTRPTEIQTYWESQYSGIDVASAKVQLIEDCGYAPEGYFALPDSCWLHNYYYPMQKRFDAFLELHCYSAQAKAIVEAEKKEIELYEKYRDYYSYGVYVAKKLV